MAVKDSSDEKTIDRFIGVNNKGCVVLYLSVVTKVAKQVLNQFALLSLVWLSLQGRQIIFILCPNVFVSFD